MRYRYVKRLVYAICFYGFMNSPVLADGANRVEQLITTVIQPAFAEFKIDASLLVDELNKSCHSPETIEAYRSAASSFSVVEIVQLGQLLRENRLERLFFWPDRKSIGQRQLRELLLNPTLAAISLPKLERKSVALQGFPALERVLFQVEPPNESACHFATTVARNIEAMAETLYEDWHSESGIASQLINPGVDSRYRTREESTSAVLRLADGGLKSIRDRKLDRIIKGIKKKGALANSAPFSRSKFTFHHLQHNLDSVSSIILDTRLSDGAGSIGKIRSEFQRAHRLLSEAESALSINQPDLAVQRLITLQFFIDLVHGLLRDDMMKIRNVSLGFNSGDGD